MRIHKLSIIVSIPLVILVAVLAFFVFKKPESNIIAFVLIPLTPLVLVYLFSPQIDYWWISRHPVELDQKLITMLNEWNPDYSKLKPEAKQEYNNRLTMFVEGRDFTAKGMEVDKTDVPYDIKMMISQIPISMTLGRDKSSFKNWERIILYKHPFPSPRYKFLHTMETFAEDGVIILSLEHVERALVQRGLHYDVAWHAYADAFIKDNPNEPYPDVPRTIWNNIERICPQDKRTILATLGFTEIDTMPVLINLYFNNEQAFRLELPSISVIFDDIFNRQKLRIT